MRIGSFAKESAQISAYTVRVQRMWFEFQNLKRIDNALSLPLALLLKHYA